MRFGIGSGSDGGGGGGIGGGGIGGGRGISWDDPLLTDSSIITLLVAADVSKRVSIRRSVCPFVHQSGFHKKVQKSVRKCLQSVSKVFKSA